MNKNDFLQVEQLEQQLRQVWTKYHEYIMPQKTNLSAQQFYFLKYIHHQHSCTPSDISKAFGITLGAITGFIDRLSKLGLVTRTRTEEDRRLVLIHLTSMGIETLEQFEQQKLQKSLVLLAQFGETETQKLKNLLERFEASLDQVF